MTSTATYSEVLPVLIVGTRGERSRVWTIDDVPLQVGLVAIDMYTRMIWACDGADWDCVALW